ncbi:MAG: hypothetical protein JOZ83_05190 [Silvibacterium sp.]|nr:hypothetical protein [Silvibacterium sp.]
MIPVAGAVRIGERRVHGFRLWIPFVLLWLVLAVPLALVTPFLFIAFLFLRVDPFASIGALFRVLGALRGTQVEVVNERVAMLVNIF